MKLYVIAIAAALAAGGASAAGIRAGDIAVYRVGDGSATTTSGIATAVFIDEYDVAGTLVQSIAMPTSASGANGILTASNTATSEGGLTLSADGAYLVATGYNAAVGTAGVAGTSSASVARTVGLVSVASGAIDTTTKLTNIYSGNNIRSAASTNGTDIWVGGTSASGNAGVGYTTKGSSSATQVSTTVTNVRQVETFAGQLYESDSAGTAIRLGKVGTGLPTTSGQTITNLPGFPTSGSPYAFFFADLSATVAGLDTLYVADDTAGIQKYSLSSGGTWTLKGTVGAASDAYRGLTGVVNGGNVTLFATGLGGSGVTGGGKLVKVDDTSGYNGTFAGTATTIATAAANTAFRGVAITAVPEPESYALMLAGLAALGAAARRRSAR